MNHEDVVKMISLGTNNLITMTRIMLLGSNTNCQSCCCLCSRLHTNHNNSGGLNLNQETLSDRRNQIDCLCPRDIIFTTSSWFIPLP
ncbi:hypothetical protein MTR_6g040060 [Medicago truncatula]|uniref:Uncharacterized protein n=1 Tax=Medicago truncatula TaxID=3880 RepID=A0A072U8C8_MEDTR|nr:hypothetical protein MTR_6g040060 [Medicago truncatula]